MTLSHGGHRHRRAGPGGRDHDRPRGDPHARASCRSAPGERCARCRRPTSTDLGVQIVLGNTYHLMLRPGADVVERLGGLHGFADWSGHVLTDSGGYQIFSLEPGGTCSTTTASPSGPPTTAAPTASPRSRRSTSRRQLGADIQMVLDVCAPLPSPAGDPARGGRPHRGAGRSGPARVPRAGRPSSGAVRHRAGRHRRRAAARERRADARASASTATPSAGCRWGSPATRCSTRSPPPCPLLPADQPAT